MSASVFTQTGKTMREVNPPLCRSKLKSSQAFREGIRSHRKGKDQCSMQGHSAQSQHKCAGDGWMACESWKALNGSTVTAAATSPLWLESSKLANTGRNCIMFHAGTMERNTSFPPKIPVYSWAVWGEKRRGCSRALPCGQGWLSPWLQGRAGVSIRVRGELMKNLLF